MSYIAPAVVAPAGMAPPAAATVIITQPMVNDMIMAQMAISNAQLMREINQKASKWALPIAVFAAILALGVLVWLILFIYVPSVRPANFAPGPTGPTGASFSGDTVVDVTTTQVVDDTFIISSSSTDRVIYLEPSSLTTLKLPPTTAAGWQSAKLVVMNNSGQAITLLPADDTTDAIADNSTMKQASVALITNSNHGIWFVTPTTLSGSTLGIQSMIRSQCTTNNTIVPATFTAVPFDTDLETINFSTDRSDPEVFIIPQTGLWIVYYMISWQLQANGGERFSRVEVNGDDTISFNTAYAAPGNDRAISSDTVPIRLTAGDQIRIVLYQLSTPSANETVTTTNPTYRTLVTLFYAGSLP